MSTETPPTIAALGIRADVDADPSVVEVGQSLAALRGYVGAANDAAIPYLEAFRLGDKAVMYLDEDGKARGLPVNMLATLMAWIHGGLSSADNIVGDVLVVGSEDADGDNRSVPSELVVWAEDVWRVVGA